QRNEPRIPDRASRGTACRVGRPAQLRDGMLAACRLPKLDRESGRRVSGERAWRAKSLVPALMGALRAALRTHADPPLENLALRQQLALLRCHSKRPRLGRLNRAFWVWLSRRWAGWREAPPRRSTRDRDPLAPTRLPRLLDLEVQTRENGSTTPCLGARQIGPHHGAGQSSLGRTTHPWRTAQARF